MIRRQKIAARHAPEMGVRSQREGSTPTHRKKNTPKTSCLAKVKVAAARARPSPPARRPRRPRLASSSRWRASTATSARASTPRASASVPVSTWAPSSSTSAPRSSSSRATPRATQEDAHCAAPHPARRAQRRGAQQAPRLGHDRVRRRAPEHPRDAAAQEGAPDRVSFSKKTPWRNG